MSDQRYELCLKIEMDLHDLKTLRYTEHTVNRDGYWVAVGRGRKFC